MSTQTCTHIYTTHTCKHTCIHYTYSCAHRYITHTFTHMPTLTTHTSMRTHIFIWTHLLFTPLKIMLLTYHFLHILKPVCVSRVHLNTVRNTTLSTFQTHFYIHNHMYTRGHTLKFTCTFPHGFTGISFHI